MSEQAVDLRSFVSILRRYVALLIVAAVLGAAAGVGAVLVWPATYTSTSQVLLPPPPQNSSGQTSTRDVATDVRVARSDAVLGATAKEVRPHSSATELGKRLSITAPTSGVIQFRARGRNPEAAERLARTVAGALVAYFETASSSLSNAQQATLTARGKTLQKSLGSVQAEIRATQVRLRSEDSTSTRGKADATALAQLTGQQASLVLQIDQVKKDRLAQSQAVNGQASVIQGASPAVRPALAKRLLLLGGAGLAAGLLLMALVLLVRGRRDHRLRSRDQIADAIGSPVIASLSSAVPRGVAGWSTLLEEYAPATVDAWALRQILHQLAFDEPGEAGSAATNGSRRPVSILVITLSDDVRGLALAPQLASYAAGCGISTRFVAAQRHEAATELWAACAAVPKKAHVRPHLLVDTASLKQRASVDLTITLAVLDRRDPQLLSMPKTTATVIALSSGSATAEDLARSAVIVDDAGSRIDGIVVADADSMDRTTGRLTRQERRQQIPLPIRLTGGSPDTERAIAARKGVPS